MPQSPQQGEQPVILSAVRTPMGKFMGGLSPLTAPELGAKVVAEAVRRAGIDPKPSTNASWATSSKPAWDRIPRARPRSRRPRLSRRRHDHQQSLRLGPEIRRPRGASGHHRRIGNPRRRRHGVHVQLPLPAHASAHRLSPRQRPAHRFHGPRRPVGSLRGLPHGRHRRARRRKIQNFAPGAGSVRPRKPSEGRARHEVLLLRTANRARRNSAEKGRPRRHQQRRNAARRHFARSPRQTQARLQKRRHRHRGQCARHERWRRGRRRHQRTQRRLASASSPWRASSRSPLAASNRNG